MEGDIGRFVGRETMNSNTMRAAFADIISSEFVNIPLKGGKSAKVLRELIRNQRDKIVSGRNPNFRPVDVRPTYAEINAGFKQMVADRKSGKTTRRKL